MAHRGGGGSCFQNGLMGLAMGGLVGTGFGLLIGGYMGRTMGLKGIHLLKIIGKTSLTSGAAFGGFMCVGSLVRCEEKNLDPNNTTQQSQIIWWKSSKFLMAEAEQIKKIDQ